MNFTPPISNCISGTASPSYGSFPPSTSATSLHSTPAEPKAISQAILHLQKNGHKKRTLKYSKQWSTSTEVINSAAGFFEEVEDEIWTAGESSSLPSTVRNGGRIRKERSSGYVPELMDVIPSAGVLKMELINSNFTKKSLLRVFLGVYLISTLISLEGNTLPTIEPYFLSLLGSHSMLSSIAIVTNLAYAVGKLPFSKVLDVFGRAEGVALAAGLYSLGFILTATANNVRVYIVARTIAALGGQGLQLSQQIIIADISSISTRGLLTSSISLPWVVTTWIGPPLALIFLNRGEMGYRFAYGTFGILLPLISLVLVITLVLEWRKIKFQYEELPSVDKIHLVGGGGGKESSLRGRSNWSESCWTVWKELDIVGALSFTIGAGLLLLPITLAAQKPEAWGSPTIWFSLLTGIGILIFFGYYEWYIAQIPLLPPRLLSNKTILAGSLMGFTHFCSQFIYESFFTSFLQVARNHSPTTAAYIAQSYLFAASVSALIAGIGFRWSRRYKWIGILGVGIHFLGTCLMLRVRNLDSSPFEVVLSQVLGGIGGGFATMAAQIGIQSVVSTRDTAAATAIFLTITQFGGAVGGALAGGIWSTILPNRLRSYLPQESIHLTEEIIASLPFALSFETGSIIRIAINRAYLETQYKLNLVALVMLIPCMISMLLMKNTHLIDEEIIAKDRVVVLGSASFIIEPESSSDSSETSSLLGPPS